MSAFMARFLYLFSEVLTCSGASLVISLGRDGGNIHICDPQTLAFCRVRDFVPLAPSRLGARAL
jgi:hypothetical protein